MIANKQKPKQNMEKELGDKNLTMRPKKTTIEHTNRHWEAWQLHCNWIPVVILWSPHMTATPTRQGPPVEEAIFVLLKSHLSISAAHLPRGMVGW